MSIRVTVHQLKEHLSEFLDRAVQSGEETIVEQDGEDYAVIVSAREWARRGRIEETVGAGDAASEEIRAEEIGRRLDALGPEYRLSREKQERMESLLAKQSAGALTTPERREIEQLAEECDEIMLRRAQALRRIG